MPTIYIVVKGIFGYTYSIHSNVLEAHKQIFKARDFDPNDDTSPFEIEKWDSLGDGNYINDRMNITYEEIVKYHKEQQNG